MRNSPNPANIGAFGAGKNLFNISRKGIPGPIGQPMLTKEEGLHRRRSGAILRFGPSLRGSIPTVGAVSMSLGRFVYYSAVVGGWTAFVAWLLAEGLVLHGENSVGFGQNVVSFALVGASLGGGLNLLAGLGNPQWKRQLYRLLAGLICGGIGGIVGSLLGNLFYACSAFRGPSAGRSWAWPSAAPAGIAEKSSEQVPQRRHRRHPGRTARRTSLRPRRPGSGMAARATAFVILGGPIGP